MTKLLSRKTVFKADLFTVYEDQVELSNKERKIYNNAIRGNAVTVFPLENNDIYLIDQYRYLHNSRLIEAVAGMIDEGETPLETAKRELKEETGIEASEWKQIGNFKSAGSIIIWSQPLFVARNLSFNKAEPEDSEDIKLVKMPLAEAVEKVMRGEISIASTSIGILLIDKLIQKGEL